MLSLATTNDGWGLCPFSSLLQRQNAPSVVYFKGKIPLRSCLLALHIFWHCILSWLIESFRHSFASLVSLSLSIRNNHDDGQVGIITTGNRGFTVRQRKHTSKTLSCVFRRGARQRAHGRILRGKLPLSFAPSDNARWTMFAVRHGEAQEKYTAIPSLFPCAIG
jgi:hypothetical protein